ncbi:hypothetical protein PInf_022183 [Phytophthora infestans]|nr:hypothetical protein PInf_022183 [Phytophthora infestans]
MHWGSQHLQIPVKRSPLQGILKRKRDYNNLPEPLSTRKRHCPSPRRALDDKLLHKIDEYKKRTGLWFSLRHGEGGSLNNVVVVEGAKELRSIVSKYNPRDVYSMNETSFFYRREPKGTLAVDRTEKGKKQSKERITVGLAGFAFNDQEVTIYDTNPQWRLG